MTLAHYELLFKSGLFTRLELNLVKFGNKG